MAFLLRIYSLFLTVFESLARLLSLLLPSLQSQLSERKLDSAMWQRFESWHASHSKLVFCYCSSAGELEQALPLLRRLAKQFDFFVVITLFSESGMRFARTQKLEFAYFKAPYDRFSVWQRLFQLLQPDLVVLVRHEFWPCFLYHARRYSKRTILIDAVASRHLQAQWFACRLRRWLLGFFDAIFVVDRQDLAFHRDILAISEQRLCVAGDTKFDRVMERRIERQDQAEIVVKHLRCLWPEARRMIIGSAWPDDIRLVVAGLKSQSAFVNWRLIIAPHDLSQDMLEWIKAYLVEAGLEFTLWSHLGQNDRSSQAEVLLVDTLGLLAEFYASCELAFVGGALHHRVHNVLEPACHGLEIGFGPRYQTSPEACWLVEKELVQVIADQSSFESWFRQHQGRPEPIRHQRLLAEMKHLTGAADRICASLEPVPSQEINMTRH